jgi:hypothetical protein
MTGADLLPSVGDSSIQLELRTAIAAFASNRPALLQEHDHECCLTAKKWFLAMDSASRMGNGALEPPTWLRERYQWGPSLWPIYWCEAVRSRVLDCAALAFLARESYKARGVPVLPALLVRRYSEQDAQQWRALWRAASCYTNWILRRCVYHEAVMVLEGEEGHLWDPSDGHWLDPELSLGYAGVVAMQVVGAQPGGPEVVRWGTHDLVVNTWASLLDE